MTMLKGLLRSPIGRALIAAGVAAGVGVAVAVALTSSDAVFLWLTVAAVLPTNAFVLIYGLRRPWWSSVLGLAILTQSIGLAVIIDFSALYQLLGPDYFGRDFIRVSGMAYIVGGSTAVTAVLVRARRDHLAHTADPTQQHEEAPRG